jgi:hypothetical protein
VKRIRSVCRSFLDFWDDVKFDSPSISFATDLMNYSKGVLSVAQTNSEQLHSRERPNVQGESSILELIILGYRNHRVQLELIEISYR